MLKQFGIPRTVTRSVKQTITIQEPKQVAVPPGTTIKFIGGVSYSYDSNATKSNAASAADSLGAANAMFEIEGPVGQNSSLALQTGVNGVRYADLTRLDTDTFVADLAYKTTLAKHLGPGGVRGTMTTDGLAVGLRNRTSFTRGFDDRKVYLGTPYVTWARSNIPLGEETNGTDGTLTYRYYANVNATAQWTLSDVAAAENASAILATTLGWRTPVAGLTVSATGTVQGKYYTDFPGGRQDLYVEALGVAAWVRGPLTVEGRLLFGHQWSTVAAAEWTGFVVQPLLRLNLQLN
jgi:hypothetical protein